MNTKPNRDITAEEPTTSTEWERIGNKLVGDIIGITASRIDLVPSKLTALIGEEEILDLLEEHDSSIRTLIAQIGNEAYNKGYEDAMRKMSGSKNK